MLRLLHLLILELLLQRYSKKLNLTKNEIIIPIFCAARYYLYLCAEMDEKVEGRLSSFFCSYIINA